jgi:hypothetical protein
VHLENDIKVILSKENPDRSYDIYIDLTLFLYEYPEVAEAFYMRPTSFLNGLRKIVLEVQREILEEGGLARIRFK